MTFADYIGIAVALVVAVYTYRWRKPPKRRENRYVRRRSDPNIHVPRPNQTLWARTASKYPGSGGRG